MQFLVKHAVKSHEPITRFAANSIMIVGLIGNGARHLIPDVKYFQLPNYME